MQQVDMRHIRKRRRHALKHEARLDERKVERLAVIRDDARDPVGEFGDRFEQRALGRKVGEKELARTKARRLARRSRRRRRLEPAAADEESVRPGTARKPGGFEVEEEQSLMRRGPFRLR